MKDIIAKLLASLIDRAFGSKPSVLLTITGILGGVAAFLAAWQPNPLPPSYQPYLVATAGILAAVAGILGHGEKAVVKVVLLFAVMLIPFSAAAQTPVQNFYAGGASYSVGASPAVAGTALYAHAIANTDGSYPTFAFTAIDAVPNTFKPFTVSSNVGIGVAQKVAAVGKVSIFMPTAAGISWNGGATGWQWNGGVLAAIPIKNGFYLAPTVRFLKSSVSGGSGYQPIAGLLFGWGK